MTHNWGAFKDLNEGDKIMVGKFHGDFTGLVVKVNSNSVKVKFKKTDNKGNEVELIKTFSKKNGLERNSGNFECPDCLWY